MVRPLARLSARASELAGSLARAAAAAGESIAPYAVDPVAIARDRWRGVHGRRIAGERVTFTVADVWESASLHHTFAKEGDLVAEVTAALEADDVFYDVGANLGAYTCAAGTVLHEGTVVAFEPHPDNRARLAENVDRNGVEARVLERALSNEAGPAGLSVGLGRASNQRHALATDPGASTIEVAATPGDELVASGEVPAPTVLKVDVEGAELAVVEGLSATLAREECRLVYCELHPDRLAERGSDERAVRRRLSELGFSVGTVAHAGGQPYLRAEK